MRKRQENFMKKNETSLKFDQELDEFEPVDKMDILREFKASTPAASQEKRLQIVVVRLEKRLLGIRVFSVREILKVSKISWLPCVPEYIAGVIAIRGEVQAIVNLRNLLHAGISQLTAQSRIILVEAGDLSAGLIVDEMLDIIDMPEQAVLPLAENGRLAIERYFDGNIGWNDRMVSLLNIDAILQAIIVDQV